MSSLSVASSSTTAFTSEKTAAIGSASTMAPSISSSASASMSTSCGGLLKSRLKAAYQKLTTTSKKSTSSKDIDETSTSTTTENLVKSHFSKSLTDRFTIDFLAGFLPESVVTSSTSSSTTSLTKQPTCYDSTITAYLSRATTYDSFGRVTDSEKLSRCLKSLGVKEGLVKFYINQHKEQESGGCFASSGSAMLCGADGFREEWVVEVGGVKGAVAEILSMGF